MLCRDEVLKAFRYEELTGRLIRMTGPHKGKQAGTVSPDGYVMVMFNGRRVLAHRIIWMMLHGEEPYEIDHIDRNRSNNALSNLRACYANENQRNASAPKTNKSGAAGVLWHKRQRKWMAFARMGGPPVHLGYFNYFIEAVYARHEFCLEHWGDFYAGMEVDVEKHKVYLEEIFGDCGEKIAKGFFCCAECREDFERVQWAQKQRAVA